ncbi:MAG: aldehyde oxidase and xanthine dehydrogenase, molybdopterin binding, partial [Verrucomicrobiaceae bacterium]|nr:aldehyde oxidase and xanthine dehydrogenase, molybdopterin binding [Verrucomicrobiaceae bacterium]
FYNGQYVAMVVADSLEEAQHAASLVLVSYDVPPAEKDMETRKTSLFVLEQNLAKAEVPKAIKDEPPVRKAGKGDAAFDSAAVKLDNIYTTPWETHNPIEPHATIAEWEGDRLTVFDASQGVGNVAKMLATAFDISPSKVRVISKFIGGAFGCKGLAWPHVPLAVAAAKAVQRPVKLVIERHDMFTNVGYRSPTLQRVQLGASQEGRLDSVIHSGYSQCAQRDVFVEAFTNPTSMMYAMPNLHLEQKIVRMNVCRPTFMRAPGEVTGMYALECAMDELAHQLDVDPVELRLRNHAEVDPLKKHPFSSKSLKQCYQVGAEKFGWPKELPKPGSVRDGHWRTGIGMAGSTYPMNRSAASARIIINADGTVVGKSATHDLGTGMYTVMCQLISEMLGVPMGSVRFDLGDSLLPQAPVAGGSQSVSSVGSAVKEAVDALRVKLLDLTRGDPASPLNGLSSDQVIFANGGLASIGDATKAETFQAILKRHQKDRLEAQAESKPADEKSRYTMHAFGVHFCEVKVDEELGIVRVSRWTCAHACGRILNAKTAHSQIRGGVVMGIGMALMEQTHIDERWGRVITDDLADYHLPVHADIPVIDSYFIEEAEDKANPIGTKGIGEIGITGAAAAVMNAVFNATGRRFRDLPLTPDKFTVAKA